MQQAIETNTIFAPALAAQNDTAVNRRSVLAGIAVAALSGGSIWDARGAQQIDPIFDLIETAKTAWQRHVDAEAVVEALEKSVHPNVLWTPRVEIGAVANRDGTRSAVYAYIHDQIIDPPTPKVEWVPRNARAEFLTYNKQRRRQLHRELQDSIERQRQIQNEVGLTKAWAARDLAQDEEWEAMDALGKATPTTTEGALAVASFFREHDLANLGDRSDETMPGFRTAVILERALLAMTGS